MALWLALWAGPLSLPLAFSPLDWHAHEMLFGYLSAAVAGFLLTAVPNWTGRMPLLGWPLAGLAALWGLGRLAMLFGQTLPPALIAAADTTFLFALSVVIAREIMAGRNWRNLKVLGLIALLAAANLLFHWEAHAAGGAAGGYGARIALASAVMLILVIGGRIVPSFTRNWLAKRAPGALPAPSDRFDTAASLLAFAALALWAALPAHGLTAGACAIAGIANTTRLLRWASWRTTSEALVWILHVGFAFAPLGLLLIAASSLWPHLMAPRAAQHAFMAGAIGVMTLAVMTRASLGHTGRPLHARPHIALIYVAAIAAALARIASGISGAPAWLLHAAGGLWIAAFAGFTLIYAPILVAPRKT